MDYLFGNIFKKIEYNDLVKSVLDGNSSNNDEHTNKHPICDHINIHEVCREK